MSELPEKVLRFDIARVNYGRRKICRCLNPHYEIDAQNRLAVCNDWWLRKNTIHQIDGQETLW